MNAWDFFQEQILGMRWLNEGIGSILAFFGMDIQTRLGSSVQFFIFDSIKIIVLLCVMIFIVSYIQSYFPPQRSRRILGRFNGVVASAMAALLGTVTPFCSCSSIPLFIGFTSAGLPLGVTLAFLISSPMVDLGSLILLMSIFGGNIAIFYVVIGLVFATLAGVIIDKLHMETYIEPAIRQLPCTQVDVPTLSVKDRVQYAYEQVSRTFKKVLPYILVGVTIGALIHNWIPQTWIESVLGANNPFSVLLATLVGIPMYADIFGAIPVAQALYSKGVQLGTVLSFMMAVTTLSLPSLIMLRNVMKPRLLALFIGVCTIGIIAVGYLFNAIQPLIGA